LFLDGWYSNSRLGEMSKPGAGFAGESGLGNSFIQETLLEPIALIPAILLGLSLAASTGLNTFLPLFLLSGATHLGYLSAQNVLGGSFSWVASTAALTALGIATLVEVLGDKIPAVDHFLDVLGTVVRPVVGAFAAASVFATSDPAMAAMAGLVIGAPIAFGFHSVKAGARVGSTTTTAGFGNPILSIIEDIAAIAITVIGIVFPWLVPAMLVIVGLLLFLIYRKVRGMWRASQGIS
jgi:uncharacterized membrane protein